ncbi:hypothetical protein [Streptomyces clavifer]|uniref:hypothetical protein n=1 Tax=Streptomyces clavifer TaxID=68188 RepID=UPI0033B713F3
MLLSRIRTAEDAEGGIGWDVSVDSTAVRAHPHVTRYENRAYIHLGTITLAALVIRLRT